jgi:hypothetical protein
LFKINTTRLFLSLINEYSSNYSRSRGIKRYPNEEFGKNQ